MALAAYDDEGVESTHTFAFQGRARLRSMLALNSSASESGAVRTPAIAAYLVSQAVPADRERLQALFESDELDVEEDALIELYKALAAEYAGRPTV